MQAFNRQIGRTCRWNVRKTRPGKPPANRGRSPPYPGSKRLTAYVWCDHFRPCRHGLDYPGPGPGPAAMQAAVQVPADTHCNDLPRRSRGPLWCNVRRTRKRGAAMELLTGLLVLAILTGPVLLIVALVNIGTLRGRVDALERHRRAFRKSTAAGREPPQLNPYDLSATRAAGGHGGLAVRAAGTGAPARAAAGRGRVRTRHLGQGGGTGQAAAGRSPAPGPSAGDRVLHRLWPAVHSGGLSRAGAAARGCHGRSGPGRRSGTVAWQLGEPA